MWRVRYELNMMMPCITYIKDKQEIVEIPRQQRFVGRPSLSQLLSLSGLTDKEQRNQKVLEAIDKFGYSQKQVANFLSIHYSTISKLIKEIKEISKFKT
jgi:putative transposase